MFIQELTNVHEKYVSAPEGRIILSTKKTNCVRQYKEIARAGLFLGADFIFGAFH